MKRISFLSALAALCVGGVSLLAGCGGGGSKSAPGATRGVGTVQMTIKWPQPTRLIPEAAQSIRVAVTAGTGQPALAERTVARPPSGQNETTVNIPNLPAGQVTVGAAAFPTADGTGVAQAAGSITVEVVAGQTTTTPALTMNSTITELRVTPPEHLTLEVGQTKDFTVSAHNAQGEVVLTAPGKFTFALAPTNPQVAFLFNETDGDATASLRADHTGTAALTLTEQESGKTLQATVTVTAPQQTGARIVDLGAAASGNSSGLALTPGPDESLVRVVGRESPPSQAEIAVEYQGGQFYNIGTIGNPGSGTVANDINDSNHVVGTANTQNLADAIAFMYRDVNGNRQPDAGEMVDLLPGIPARAEAINNGNVVVGTKIDTSTNQPSTGFVENNGTVTDLASLGGTRSQPLDININGVVVGSSALASGEQHAVVWQPAGGGSYSSPIDLGTLPGSTISAATAINTNGEIVGYSYVPDPAGSASQQPRAFVTTGSGLQALPLLNATDRSSEAYGINAAGDIVGRINIGTGPTTFTFVAVKWTKDQSGNYQVVNLNTLHGTGWNLTSAQDINDQGVITGQGTNPSGQQHGYLLIP